MYKTLEVGSVLPVLLAGILCFSDMRRLEAQALDDRSVSSFERVHYSDVSHNARSCAECHSVPQQAGSSPVTVTRAGTAYLGNIKELMKEASYTRLAKVLPSMIRGGLRD